MSAGDPSSEVVALSYGGFWRRVGATVIDGLIFVLINGLFYAGAAATEEAASGFGIIAGLVYEVGMTASRFQGTLGKLALGIRVVDLDGRRVTPARALGRWFAKILSALLFCVGYLMVAFTDRKRALHDMLAGTLVVHVARNTGPAIRLPA